MRTTVFRILLNDCALFAVVPATAGAATPPKVTSVAPLKLKIGERLTIRGKGFLPGKNRNTVVFKATGTRAVFAKAASATKTRLAVKVPVKLSSFLKVKAGQPTATRFQLRVLARKLSPAYTPAKRSPVIAPAAAAAATKGPDAKAPVTAATPATGAGAAAAAAAAPPPPRAAPPPPPPRAAPAAATPTPTPAPSVDVADCDSDGTPDATDD